MTTTEDIDDPFLRHFHRDPLPDAGIRIILLTELPPDRAEAVVAPLADRLAAMGRAVETRIVPVADVGPRPRLEPGDSRVPDCRSCW